MAGNNSLPPTHAPYSFNTSYLFQTPPPHSQPAVVPVPAAAPVPSPSSSLTVKRDRDLSDSPPTSSSSSKVTRPAASNAVIACRQCRARKIRCDSTRPSCNNCVRRANACEYDNAPKRRGPDKVPGTRKRSARKRAETIDGLTPSSAAVTNVDMEVETSRKRPRRQLSVQIPAPDPIVLPSLPQTGMEESATQITQATSAGPYTPGDHSYAEFTLQRSGSSTRALPTPTRTPLSGVPFTRSPHDAPYSRTPLSGSFAESTMQAAARPPFEHFTSSMEETQRYHSFGQYSGSTTNFNPNTAGVFERDVAISNVARASPLSPLSPLPTQERIRWWDDLVSQYSDTPEMSVIDIENDLTFLFSSTLPWLSFMHLPTLLQTLRIPTERAQLQPSLVYSALGLATLLRSSEAELGSSGRDRAVWLRNFATSLMESAWNSRLVDNRLAQAALLLAVFESSAHPDWSAQAERHSLQMLDQILVFLQFPALDINDAGASTFTPGAVPHIPAPVRSRVPPPLSISEQAMRAGGVPLGLPSPASSAGVHSPPAAGTSGSVSTVVTSANVTSMPMSGSSHTHAMGSRSSPTPPACGCRAGESATAGPTSAQWDPIWTVEQISREESRRVTWAAVSLFGAFCARCTARDEEGINLTLLEAGNFSLLFPDEDRERSIRARSPISRYALGPKESIWALYCRSLLLWNACFIRLRTSARAYSTVVLGDREAEFAVEAFNECRALEEGRRAHTCNGDVEMLYATGEYIHHTRQMVSQVFRRMQDIEYRAMPSRRQAEDWIASQAVIAQRIKASIQTIITVSDHVFIRRPWQLVWLVNQIATCLSLFNQDPTLVSALELAKTFLAPCDVLCALWPSPGQQHQCDEQRGNLERACLAARITGPLPPEFSVPPHLRQGQWRTRSDLA